MYHVETREYRNLQLTPNKKSPHILDCKYYFGVKKNGYVFGKETGKPTISEGLLLFNGVEAITTIKGTTTNTN